MPDALILAELGISIDPFTQGLATARAQAQQFAADVAPLLAIKMPAFDTSSLSTASQAMSAVAQSEQTLTQTGTDLVTVTQAATASAADLSQAQGVVAQASQVAAQAEANLAAADHDALADAQARIAALQENVAALRASKEHTDAASESQRHLVEAGTELGNEVLPGLSRGMELVKQAAGSMNGELVEAGAGAAAIGLAVAGLSFAQFDKGVESLHQLALESGTTEQEMQGFETTMQAVGLQTNQTQMLVLQFQRGLEQAKNALDQGKAATSPFALGLKELGVNLTDSEGRVRSMQQLLPEIFDGFKLAHDSAALAGQSFDTAGVAGELFGARMGGRLVPALLGGSAALKENTQLATDLGVASEAQIAHLEAWNESSARLKLQMTALGDALGSDVAPVLTSIARVGTDFFDVLNKLPGPAKDLLITLPLLAGGGLLAGNALAGMVSKVLLLGPAESAAAASTAVETAAIGAEATAAQAAGLALDTMLGPLGLIIGVGTALVTVLSTSTGGFGENSKATEQNTTETSANTAAIEANARARTGQFGDQQRYQALIGAYNDALRKQNDEEVKAAGIRAQGGQAAIDEGNKLNVLSGNTFSAFQILTQYQRQANLTQTALGTFAVSADDAARSQSQLAATLSINAANMSQLAAVVRASNASTESQAVFVAELDQAQHFAALSAGEQAKATQQLDDEQKSGSPGTKEYAKNQEDLDQIVVALTQHYGLLAPAILAADVAIAQIAERTDQAATATKAMASEIQQAGTQSVKFNTDLATAGATSSAEWANAYGASVQKIASDMHTASQQAVQDWQTANGQTLRDQMALQQAITSGASQEEQKRLRDAIDADQAREKSSIDTANQLISNENSYTKAVEKATSENLGYAKDLKLIKLKLAYETVDEQKTDLSVWLNAEAATISAIMDLNQQLLAQTSAITRAITLVRIAALQQQLSAETGNAEVAQTQAGYIQKQETADKRDATAATREANAAITAETNAINERTAAQKAGLDVARQEEDLAKTVGASKRLVSEQEVASLHQQTEAARASAQGLLDATAAAQRDYQAQADAAGGASSVQVAAAKAAYNAVKEQSDGAVAVFDAALQQESQAQSLFDAQQAASAASRAQYTKDSTDLLRAEADTQASFAAAVITSGDRIGAAQLTAAGSAYAAWHDADARVLADEKALTGALSEEDRKRLDSQLKNDQAAAAGAKATYTDVVTAAKAQSAALTQLDNDRRAISKQTHDLLLADVRGMNTDAVAAYRAASAAVLADEQALTGNLSDADRTRLAAQLDIDRQIQASALDTAQVRIKAENDYVQAARQASNQVLGLESNLFDARHHLASITTEERRAGLDSWLQKEIAVTQQIQALEIQLAQTTDAIRRASIQSTIDGLSQEVAAIKVMEHEAETVAQDMANAARDAASSSANAMGGAVYATGAASEKTKEQVQANLDALNAQMNATVVAITRVQQAYQELQGVFQTPSTEESTRQVKVDQLTIQKSHLEESGVASTDPRIVAIQKQIDAQTAQIQAYANERKAQEDLAKTQGTLNSQTTNGIDLIRQSTTELAKEEEAQRRANTVTLSFASQSGQAIRLWATDVVTEGAKVAASFQPQIDALNKLQKTTKDVTTTSGAAFGENAKAADTMAKSTVASFTTMDDATKLLQGTQAKQTTDAVFDWQVQQKGATDWSAIVVNAINPVTAAYNALAGAERDAATAASEVHGTRASVGNEIGSMPHYALGTPYVPQDGPAYLHRGEAVVPAAQAQSMGGAINLTINNTVNGSNLSGPQLEQAIENGGKRAARAVLSEALGRGQSLSGVRVA